MIRFNFEKDKLLVLLILTDLALFGLHLVYVYTDFFENYLFHVGQHRGYPEFFQYIKELWIAVLFFFLAVRKRKLLYFLYSLLFVFILFDDSFEFHERVGGILAEIFQIQSLMGLRPQDFGELIVYAFFGILFFVPIAIVHFMSDRETQTVGKYLYYLLILLILAGVAFDMIDIMVDNPILSPLLSFIEDGGEMVVMTFITWYAYRLNQPGEPLLAGRIKDPEPVES
jgi:hypothetical protein